MSITPSYDVGHWKSVLATSQQKISPLALLSKALLGATKQEFTKARSNKTQQ